MPPTQVSNPGRGLVNPCDTCHLNSAMQLLAACKPLRAVIASIDMGNSWYSELRRAYRKKFPGVLSTPLALERECQGVLAALKDSNGEDPVSPDRLLVRFSGTLYLTG